MHRNIVMNSHWLLKGLWNMVWGWLDPFVQQKIIVTQSEEDAKKTLFEYIPEDQIEQKYGGTKPDI